MNFRDCIDKSALFASVPARGRDPDRVSASSTPGRVPDLSRVRRVCQQYLDQQRDMEPCRLDSLQTSSTNEQRPRRLAPRDQPSSGWQVTTPTLRPDQAATPGSLADSYPGPFGIREKTTKDPAPQIQRPAGKNLQSLGAI